MKHTSSIMVRSARQLHFIVVVLFGSLALTEPVYAYLDPGTGSIIMQIILGGIAGLAVAGKLFWASITDYFRNIFTRGGSRRSETTTLPTDETSMDAGQVSEHNDQKQ